MAGDKERTQELDDNAFGKLVKSFREQRGLSQGKLAEQWGHTREYVSQIERGRRKLDKQEQINRLADILDIPSERLEAIGKGIPQRQVRLAERPAEADDILLQTLLEPSLATVKLSWLLWLADGKNMPVSEESGRVNDQIGGCSNQASWAVYETGTKSAGLCTGDAGKDRV